MTQMRVFSTAPLNGVRGHCRATVCDDQLETSIPPFPPPLPRDKGQAFQLLKIGLFNSCPLSQNSVQGAFIF